MVSTEVLSRLKALKELDYANYMRINRRQAKGLMTKYVHKGQLFYDPQEDYEKSRGGRRIKGYILEKKPTIIVEKL